MANALPLQQSVDHTPRDRTVLTVGDEKHAEVLQKLSSDTAREILHRLSDDPMTTSEVADAVDISIQNAHYHLTRLVETGIIEAIDTWYSAKGKEMTVYALTAEELVIRFSANRPQPS